MLRHVVIALAIGLAVMAAAILCIITSGDAAISHRPQPAASAVKFGSRWLLADLSGAPGEELYGRAARLLLAERFLGWQGAIAVSGVIFLVIHLGNPGASGIWLLRLGIQAAHAGACDVSQRIALVARWPSRGLELDQRAPVRRGSQRISRPGGICSTSHPAVPAGSPSVRSGPSEACWRFWPF